jgi:hypothetical protein
MEGNGKELGWQCRDLCLSATPPKQQTFVSVADMSRHVGPTRRRHSVKSAFFSAVGVVSGETVANTLPYMYVGISTTEVGGNWKRFQLGDVVGMLLGGRRMQQPTINGSVESN